MKTNNFAFRKTIFLKQIQLYGETFTAMLVL